MTFEELYQAAQLYVWRRPQRVFSASARKITEEPAFYIDEDSYDDILARTVATTCSIWDLLDNQVGFVQAPPIYPLQPAFVWSSTNWLIRLLTWHSLKAKHNHSLAAWQQAESAYKAAVLSWLKSFKAHSHVTAQISDPIEALIAANSWSSVALDTHAAWQQLEDQITAENEAHEVALIAAQQAYRTGETRVVSRIMALAAIAQPRPSQCPRGYQFNYDKETQALSFDMDLPEPDRLKKVSRVRRQNFKQKETAATEKQVREIYDRTIYELIIGAAYWLFTIDDARQVHSIIANGRVTYISGATGKEVTAYILSMQISREQFEQTDFVHVDAKQCFRHLKGIGSAQLSEVIPINPIMRLDRDDKRFVDSRDVADTLTETTNLAAMDWEDFEHLVREVMERRLSKDGIEVKITQSSRDKGVDAIAFDPDPIRGGKIIIQAKRYTNTVDVSAVRDLYGTVHNEGATKGIIVTTSSFGPDAYEFAKGKPLTLISGSELLGLLQEQGIQAKIDLAEARKIAGRTTLPRHLRQLH